MLNIVFFSYLLLGKCNICYVEISLALNIYTGKQRLAKEKTDSSLAYKKCQGRNWRIRQETVLNIKKEENYNRKDYFSHCGDIKIKSYK